MFIVQPSPRIISILKEVLSEIEVNVNSTKDLILHELKKRLCKHFQNEINNYLPELERQIDQEIDQMIPVHNQEIIDAVNAVVNNMIEEIEKEINSYLNNL
jgi:hypothetical protein